MDAEENATRSDEVKDKKRMSYKDEHEAYAAARVTQFVFQVIFMHFIEVLSNICDSQARTRISQHLISTQIHLRMMSSHPSYY
jgi:hypothetical protein